MEKLSDTLTVVGRIEESTHKLEDRWITARVRGWMFKETLNAANPWWLCTVTADRKLIESSHDALWKPDDLRRDYAHKACRYVNKHAGFGGVWFVGWIDDALSGGSRFYLCWKDWDGDIQVPVECDLGVEHMMQRFQFGHWANLCAQALQQWGEWRLDMELKPDQMVKHAQGQPASPVAPEDEVYAE